MKTIDSRRVSIKAALATAAKFREHAEKFWNTVAAHSGHADIAAANDIGELVVSATSITLAIELYLKALLLALGQQAPMTHDLHDLFTRIPKKSRHEIEGIYQSLRLSEDPDGTSGVSVHVVHQGNVPPTFRRPAASPDLLPLLKRNASAFTTWRYLFAHGSTRAGEPLSFEYLRLSYAASAVHDVLLRHLGVSNAANSDVANSSEASQEEPPK